MYGFRILELKANEGKDSLSIQTCRGWQKNPWYNNLGTNPRYINSTNPSSE